ncbi:MAG: KpsF/GutQ family sugar-phosphate isomerase [Saprospiraceae bacterium]|nr:KpsF/GutQ family sugar-phosphate isomerase [Saprospiraceae bacterium]MDW8230418.1 KpsF/GutQ family sugar-phosphate isomerase [Saprospiraceae bacterium]
MNTPSLTVSVPLDVAQQTIRLEAQALLALADSLEQSLDFQACVEAIFRGSGRVVLTGIGKSALVAQKIAATLNSTGQPALFLHAADAIHGDLGMVQPGDWVVCLSKSGETPEIKVLASLVKGLGNRLIAITANRQSTLARQADYVLWTPVEQEADPNNLAPTVSTTSQMALGDALATALLTLRGFTPEDFARFHPGGALGKQLYLRVGELSARHERPAVTLDAPLREVIIEMTAKRLGATAVLDQDGKIVGIITDGDLRRMLQKNADVASITARQIMTLNPKCVPPDTLAARALEMMRQHAITQLLVTQDEQYLGIVHLHDLLREGFV